MSAASRKAVTDKIVTHADGEIERLRVRVRVLESALRELSRCLDCGHSYDYLQTFARAALAPVFE